MSGVFTCLITDSRYAVPTLSFYLAAEPAQARELALADLRANRWHEAVEVRDGDEVLFVVTRENLEQVAAAE